MAVADHRYCKTGPKAARTCGLLALIKRIAEDVRDVADDRGSYRPRHHRLIVEPHRIGAPYDLDALLRNAVDPNEPDQVAIDHGDDADLGIAKFLGTLPDCFKNGI